MSKTLKIGELAKATGLTVRTLHHYDDIGLLKPSIRTEAGHRLYTASDVKRLQTIVSLQSIQFSLKDIKSALEQDSDAFEHALDEHVKRLESELAHKQALYNRLSQLQYRIKANEEVSLEDYVKNIEVIVMYEKYYSQEQIEELRNRDAQLSEAEKQKVHEDWMNLFEGFKKAYAEKLEVTDPKVIRLGELANEYTKAFTGGDPNMEQSHQKMYQTEGGSNVLAQHGVDMPQEVFEFMAKAMGAAKAKS